MNDIESLYIHFPFCKHLCNYCDFFKKVPDNAKVDFLDFENYLVSSWQKHSELLTQYNIKFSSLDTLYIGGGTPSYWGASGAKFFNKFLGERNLTLKENCEFTLEVNPKVYSDKDICAWKDIGVNRFSIGIQSLDENYLKLLDRYHSTDDAFATLKYFSEIKSNYSVDLMIGLPFSLLNKRDIVLELNKILEYGPKHFSVYILTTKSHYPYQNDLPDEQYIEDEYLKVCEHLKNIGYIQYEVSNFSLPGFESRHNVNYWNTSSVAALGRSGTGFFKINTDHALRYKWKVAILDYEVEMLTGSNLKLEKLYLGLRTNRGIKLDEFFNKDEKALMMPVINNWHKNHLLESFTSDSLRLNSRGFLIMDSLLNEAFRYLSW